MSSEYIELWSDGSADLGIKASYGYVIVWKNGANGKIMEGMGVLKEGPFTAPHAELEGFKAGMQEVIVYLNRIGKRLPIHFYCDATFITKSMTEWGDQRGLNYSKWSGKEYGRDLFTLYSWIVKYREHSEFKITHVKSHSGIRFNERADQLAKEASLLDDYSTIVSASEPPIDYLMSEV